METPLLVGMRGICTALKAIADGMAEQDHSVPSSTAYPEASDHLGMIGRSLDAAPKVSGPLTLAELRAELADIELVLIELMRHHPQPMKAIAAADEFLENSTGEDMPAVWGNSAAGVMHRFAEAAKR